MFVLIIARRLKYPTALTDCMQRAGRTIRLLESGKISGLLRLVLFRTILILVLLVFSIGVLYLARDGFVDKIDGSISVLDVTYFMFTSVITLSYGDIIPASQTLRIIDTVLLTVVRVFIWLILFGTAYEVLFNRSMEVLRMRSLKTRLKNHYIVCGLGELGRSVIEALKETGVSGRQIVGIDLNQAEAQAVADEDIPVLHADAAREHTLVKADIKDAKTVSSCARAATTPLSLSPSPRSISTQMSQWSRGLQSGRISPLSGRAARTRSSLLL